MNLLSDRIKQVFEENPGLEGQAGLVKASGASKSVVNQWLDNKIKSMRLDYALKIEEELGYNHIWLVLGIGEKKVSKLEVEVIRYFRLVRDDLKPMTVATVKSHADASKKYEEQAPTSSAQAPDMKSSTKKH